MGTFSDWKKSSVVCYHVRLERDMGMRLGNPGRLYSGTFFHPLEKQEVATEFKQKDVT